MDETPNLGLPYIMAAQSQKHVTHNEAIRALDAIVQLSVLDRDLTAPPGSPADGARYIVGASPTGAWSGHAGDVAAFQDGAWAFYEPVEGFIAWIADEDTAVVWSGSAWTALTTGSGGAGSFSTVGINATADATNKLTVAAAATLLNHAGAGHQVKINKAAAGNTASLLYQDAFSGRAELGLAGDDDFHFKVSPDGSAWKEAIVIDRSSGVVSFPFTTFSGGIASNSIADGRLTLQSGVQISTTDQTAKTTLYYTPSVGNRIALYDGSAWQTLAFTEKSISLSGLTANTLYDVWGYLGSGDLALELLAWSNSGAGTSSRATALARQDGVPIKSGVPTRRYLGTIRITGTTGQCEFSYGGNASGGKAGYFGVWNYYNRRQVITQVTDVGTSYTYAGAGAFRQARNSSGNQIAFVVGVSGDGVFGFYQNAINNGSGATGAIAVGYDAVNTYTGSFPPSSQTGIVIGLTAFTGVAPAEGYHFLATLDYSTGGTTTFENVTFGGAAFVVGLSL